MTLKSRFCSESVKLSVWITESFWINIWLTDQMFIWQLKLKTILKLYCKTLIINRILDDKNMKINYKNNIF